MALRSSSEPVTPTATRLVWQEREGRFARKPDQLAVEEPLEIRLARGSGPAGSGGPTQVLTVTMRTPGHDFELVTGWLIAEGVVEHPSELRAVRYCTDPDLDGEQRYNVVTVDVAPAALERHLGSGGVASRLTPTSSACGVCGTSSIEVLAVRRPDYPERPGAFALADVLEWPERLRRAQPGHSATGGLHAAGLVSADGELLVAREDVGRHNAVDKVIGWAAQRHLEGSLEFPLTGLDLGLVVSGRSSFEIVQKALAAGIAAIVSVSAASSLAARLADEHGLTLVGFVRDGRATVYSHPSRLKP
jgi:FdhD protein